MAWKNGNSALELGANLADEYLPGADLDYSNLLAATFTGTHLSRCALRQCLRKHLQCCRKLPGGPDSPAADLTGADLTGAKGLRAGSLRKSASLCSPPLLATNGKGLSGTGHPHAQALAE